MGDSLSWAADQEEEAEWRKLEALRKKNDIPGDKRPTLKKYNDQEKELHDKMSDYPKLNGILCDQCHAELYDTNGVVKNFTAYKDSYSVRISTTGLGTIEVMCKCCGFSGERIASQ